MFSTGRQQVLIERLHDNASSLVVPQIANLRKRICDHGVAELLLEFTLDVVGQGKSDSHQELLLRCQDVEEVRRLKHFRHRFAVEVLERVVRMVVVDLADTAFRRRNRDRGVSLEHLANLIAQDRILAEFRGHDHTSALEQIRRVLSLRRVGVDELIGERKWLKVAVHRPVDARSRGEVDGDFLCFSAEALKRY